MHSTQVSSIAASSVSACSPKKLVSSGDSTRSERAGVSNSIQEPKSASADSIDPLNGKDLDNCDRMILLSFVFTKASAFTLACAFFYAFIACAVVNLLFDFFFNQEIKVFRSIPCSSSSATSWPMLISAEGCSSASKCASLTDRFVNQVELRDSENKDDMITPVTMALLPFDSKNEDDVITPADEYAYEKCAKKAWWQYYKQEDNNCTSWQK